MVNNTQMTQSSGPRLIERAIDVLMALSDGPKTFTAVCREVGLSKATIHRILTGLSHRELVVQDATTSEYMLGAGGYRLARGLYGSNGAITSLMRPTLIQLRAETEETVIMHVRIGTQRVCIAELESPQPLRYTVGVGHSSPLHVGSAGKVLLAWLDEGELRKLLPDHLDALTEATITDWSLLLEELDSVRQQGWAESHGERVQGAFAVSAPVFDDRSRVAACVSILGPEARLTRARFIELRRAVLDAARTASRLLGAESSPGTA